MVTSSQFNNNKFNKSNYVEVYQKITPDFYLDKESAASGMEIDPVAGIINTHLDIADDINTLFAISAVNEVGTSLSITDGVNTGSGIAKFFIKQNDLTKFRQIDFEREILNPLGKSFKDFTTSSEFKDYLASGLLSSIQLNDAASVTHTASAYDNTASGTHDYLARKLGWFYFLNKAGDGDRIFEPSSYVVDSLVSSTYFGKTLETVDGIKGITRFLWFNQKAGDGAGSFSSYTYSPFLSGTTTYTSGVQQLEKLETLLDVIYSPLHLDRADTKVKDAFEDRFFGVGDILKTETSKGPFYKFLKAVGYATADTVDEVENLLKVYDIDNCPEEHLQYIADLIGWEFFGFNTNRWRLQLKSAVDIYKRVGTKAGLQAVMNSIYSKDIFDVSSNITELHESYIPYMILYCLLTASPFFETLASWKQTDALKAGILAFSNDTILENAKIVTDYILFELVLKYPNSFSIGNSPFPVYRFLSFPKSTPIGHLGITQKSGEKELYSLIFQSKTKDYVYFPHSYPEMDEDISNENIATLKEFAEEQGYSEDLLRPIFGPNGPGTYVGIDGQTDAVGILKPGWQSSLNSEGKLKKYFDDAVILEVSGNPDWVFNYRGHPGGIPIPPFEEYLYWKDSKLNSSMVTDLESLLYNFRVSYSVRTALSSYLRTNVLTADTIQQALSEWLLFTSGIQFPPNYEEILSSPGSSKSDYFSYWNAKSSHFMLNFEASSFDFLKNTLDSDGSYSVAHAGKAAKRFSPAKAIPKTNLVATVSDDNATSSTSFSYLEPYAEEAGSIYTPMSKGLYGGIPLNGLYTRTGFNMPLSYDASVVEYSMASIYGPETNPSSLGWLPLGLVPELYSFANIGSSVIPPDWAKANQTLDSSSTFSGLEVSNTFPCRGLSVLGSDAKHDYIASSHDRYQDRGQLADVLAVLHSINEKINNAKGWEIAWDLVDDKYNFKYQKIWKNMGESYANQYLQDDPQFTTSLFGAGIANIYNKLTYFGTDLSKNIVDLPTVNVISHLYGPLLYNGIFTLAGSSLEASSAFSASDAGSVYLINNGAGSGILSTSGTTNIDLYTHMVNDATSLPLPISATLGTANDLHEYRQPYLISGVEFVDTSNSPQGNHFSILQFGKSQVNINSLVDNPLPGSTILKLKTIGGIPRIRFDLQEYGNRDNLLLEDNNYELTLSAALANEAGTKLGGGYLGVWIHTEPIDGVVWSWRGGNPDIENFYLDPIKDGWVSAPIDDISLTYVQGTVGNLLKIPEETLKSKYNVFNIGNLADSSSVATVDNPNSLNLVERSWFKPYIINFDTFNSNISTPVNELVHTTNRKYYVEIFFTPTPGDYSKYVLLDKVSIINKSLAKGTFINTGVKQDFELPFDDENNQRKIQLSKDDTLTIIRHLKYLGTTTKGKGSGALTVKKLVYRDDFTETTPYTNTAAGVLGGTILKFTN